MVKVGVCLSGCGVFDGTEIHEAVLTLLALDLAGAEAVCMAPQIEQMDVVDHLLQAPVPGQVRNVLTESARIARGKIQDLARVRSFDIDALVFPGGFGAAKNLSTVAVDGAAARVNPEAARLVGEMLDANKPVGAMCIAPAMLARILGERGISARLTVGNDPETAAAIDAMGCEHVTCPVNECILDEELKLVTTPAYMLGESPAEIYEGIRKLVDQVLALTGKVTSVSE